MFMVPDGKRALEKNRIINFPRGLVLVSELQTPAGELGLIKSEIAGISPVRVFGVLDGIIHQFHVIIAESGRPLRMKTEIQKPICAPKIVVVHGFLAIQTKGLALNLDRLV